MQLSVNFLDRIQLRAGTVLRLQDEDLPQFELRSPNIKSHPWVLFDRSGIWCEIVIRHSIDPHGEQRWRSLPGSFVGPHPPHRHDAPDRPECQINLEGYFGEHMLRIREDVLEQLCTCECFEEDWNEVARIQDWRSNGADHHPQEYLPGAGARP